MTAANRPLRVFLCHSSNDKPAVRELYQKLRAEPWIQPWLDEVNLLPGQEWDIEIEKAVEQADVVIVCLSNKSLDKEGYVQKELRFVLNIADEKPEGTIFVVPLRLDDCQVPRRIRAWQYVDYFPKNNQAWAYQRLIESLKLRAGKLGITIEDEKLKAEREQKAKDERENIALRKAEAERVAREKVEEARRAKAERDRIARQKAEERKKALTETVNKINYKSILTVGGIVIAVLVLFLIGKSVSNNLPALPSTTETLTIPTVTVTSPTEFATVETKTSPTWTFTPVLKTETVTPTFTPTATSLPNEITDSKGIRMNLVSEGKFTMGSEKVSETFVDEGPIREVYLGAYYMDVYEVTNMAYKKCVNDGVCELPTDTIKYNKTTYADHPVVFVNWDMAKAYCEWRDARLPTEEEWEKSARGTDGRTYPWGENKPTCGNVNYGYNGCVGDTTPVGSYESGKSPYGMYDMSGNVWEWTSDSMIRGGSWVIESHMTAWLSTTFRYGSGHYLDYSVGFRCTKSP